VSGRLVLSGTPELSQRVAQLRLAAVRRRAFGANQSTTGGAARRRRLKPSVGQTRNGEGKSFGWVVSRRRSLEVARLVKSLSLRRRAWLSVAGTALSSEMVGSSERQAVGMQHSGPAARCGVRSAGPHFSREGLRTTHKASAAADGQASGRAVGEAAPRRTAKLAVPSAWQQGPGQYWALGASRAR
jgi:hypothetical protein